MKRSQQNDPSEFLDSITPKPALTDGTTINCPNCGAVGKAPNLAYGTIVRCAKCGASVRLPDPPGALDFLGDAHAAASPQPSPFMRRRIGLEPHRGGMILTFGILGFFIWPLALCAWVMGLNDLDKIHAGQMDANGRSETETGMTLGCIGTILGVIGWVLVAIVWARLFSAIGQPR